MQNPDLRKSILEGAVNSDTKDLSIELSEIAIDGLFEEGIAKEIPVLRTVIAAKKTWDSIHDQLFLRKVAAFFVACPAFTQAERERFVREHVNDAEKARHLGDTIVLILDKLDDLDKPAMLAKCFAALVRGKITVAAFRRCAMAVDTGFVEDLKTVSTYHGKDREIPVECRMNLALAGLFQLTSGTTTYDGIVVPIYGITQVGTTFLNCMNEDANKRTGSDC